MVMWLWIAVAYVIGAILLMRFFQVVKMWDEDIEAMEGPGHHGSKRHVSHYRSAA
jgi:hypothetical protein